MSIEASEEKMLSKKYLLDGFGKVKIESDTIVVHTSYKSLGGVDGGVDTVIDVMRELMGKDGTVLFPTFNFQSWTETHYFDVLETPSKMGMITEQARLRPDAKRSPHPIYSFAVLGARADEFARTEDVEAYGPNSAFALFHRLNATIISIGLDFKNSFSMNHLIEYNVGCDYRRIKEFAGTYMGYDRAPQIKMYTMYVRAHERVKTYIVPGMNDLLHAGIIKEIRVGAAKVHYMTANEFFDNMSVIVREHPEKLHQIEEPRY
ncbi:MAG: AAC(3) family N-acetyltransferase [Chloroflexi bacterium]|nr:AAC(3) family N-acetyltransferase [Chloroflexota bacterium]